MHFNWEWVYNWRFKKNANIYECHVLFCFYFSSLYYYSTTIYLFSANIQLLSELLKGALLFPSIIGCQSPRHTLFVHLNSLGCIQLLQPLGAPSNYRFPILTRYPFTAGVTGTHSRSTLSNVLHVVVSATRCMYVFVWPWPPSGHLPTDSCVLLSAQGCVLHTRGQHWNSLHVMLTSRFLHPVTGGLDPGTLSSLDC